MPAKAAAAPAVLEATTVEEARKAKCPTLRLGRTRMIELPAGGADSEGGGGADSDAHLTQIDSRTSYRFAFPPFLPPSLSVFCSCACLQIIEREFERERESSVHAVQYP